MYQSCRQRGRAGVSVPEGGFNAMRLKRMYILIPNQMGDLPALHPDAPLDLDGQRSIWTSTGVVSFKGNPRASLARRIDLSFIEDLQYLLSLDSMTGMRM